MFVAFIEASKLFVPSNLKVKKAYVRGKRKRTQFFDVWRHATRVFKRFSVPAAPEKARRGRLNSV